VLLGACDYFNEEDNKNVQFINLYNNIARFLISLDNLFLATTQRM
jgi:hypothetical protein